MSESVRSVKENLTRILEDIKNYNPTIIAVTKYYTIEKMIEAFDCGLRNFAESKAQDGVKKINNLDDTRKSQSVYHFIGHLQTNKVKHVVGNFQYIHSVDSLKLLKAIDLEANKKGIIQKVLIQVNNALEPQKFGINPSELDNLIDNASRLNSIEVVGLMNIAPLNCEKSELIKLFTQMKELKDCYNLKELSMGMSDDYKIAVECGATMVRLGRILFN